MFLLSLLLLNVPTMLLGSLSCAQVRLIHFEIASFLQYILPSSLKKGFFLEICQVTMSAPNKAIELQLQMKQNAEELQDFMRELESWEKDIKEVDSELRKQSGVSEEVKITSPVSLLTELFIM